MARRAQCLNAAAAELSCLNTASFYAAITLCGPAVNAVLVNASSGCSADAVPVCAYSAAAFAAAAAAAAAAYSVCGCCCCCCGIRRPPMVLQSAHWCEQACRASAGRCKTNALPHAVCCQLQACELLLPGRVTPAACTVCNEASQPRPKA